jgi:type II secretory pathway component PulF
LSSSAIGPLTIEQLAALNGEIAALVRAGVPLEEGLGELGADMPGRLGKVARLIAERAGRGESLQAILADPSAGFPPVYQAVVAAGLRTGRLPVALESLAGSLRRVTETRRAIASACLYPLLLLILAWGFFSFFSAKIAPALLSAFDAFRVPGRAVFAILANLGRWGWYWVPVVPVLVVFLAAVWWRQTRRATLIESGRANYLLGGFPWIGETLRCSRAAAFAELLALLIENGVPLHEAITLAAGACGDRQLMASAQQLDQALQRGATLAQADGLLITLPPLLRWVMRAGPQQRTLLPALRHAAAAYQRRAQHRADAARTLLPVLLTLLIGGTATFTYALALFVPYTTMLKALAR